MLIQNRKENRQIVRVSPSSDIPVEMKLLGSSMPASISDYSPKGLGLVLKANWSDSLKESVESCDEVVISFNSQNLYGNLRYGSENSKLKKLGIEFDKKKIVNSSNYDQGAFSWSSITDKKKINEVFDDLSFCKNQMTSFKIGLYNYFGLIDDSTQDNLVASISDSEKIPSSGKLRCIFNLYDCCYSFEANYNKVASRILIQVPNTIIKHLRRETSRVPYEKATHGHFCFDSEMANSFASDILRNSELIDFCESGFCIRPKFENQSLPIGLNLSDLNITSKLVNFRKIETKAKVSNYRYVDGRMAYGFKFKIDQEPYSSIWKDFVLSSRYKTLSFDYADSDHKKIWKLFDRSGYLELKEKNTFKKQIYFTKKTWKKIYQLGNEYSKRITLVKNNDIVAHLQMDRMFPQTWYLHHLAIDPSVLKIISKEIYSVTSDVFSSEKSKYVLTLTETSKKWNQKNYYDFIKGYPEKNHHSLKKFNLYNVYVNKLKKKNSQYVNRNKNKYELKKILRFYELNMDSLAFKAYGFGEDFLLKDFSKELFLKGVFRKRDFIVALYKEKMVGFCQLEMSENGVNILNYFDMAYVFVLENVFEKSEVIQALVSGASDHYLMYKKNVFSLILDTDKSFGPILPGIEYICEDTRWIGVSASSRHYQSYINELYGHILLKREKIRKKINKN
ncbi:MAG: hypothetical protein KDD52_02625 [Bdellovibrionales bacterium]|nr:hypothetical protein [Bdellovibrionales bacterium]